jgi:gamma-glutamyl phosphate reductase
VPKTHAERQAAYRHRQAAVIAALRSDLAEARAILGAKDATIARLEHERDRLYKMLETVNETTVSTSTGPAANCPHPAHLVDGGWCTGCGQLVDSW